MDLLLTARLVQQRYVGDVCILVHVHNWYGYVWQKVGEFVFHLNLRFDFKF